jgi:hypothetical protein
MRYKNFFLLASMGFAALLYSPSPASAQVSLGSAERFAALAGAAVTCTDSVVTGDVGVYPGSAVTVTRCTISGTVHAGDTVAGQAYADFLIAYDALGKVQCDQTIDGNLAGQVLTPGVYCVAGFSATTNGTLWLDGSSNDTWIFKIGNIVPSGYLEGTSFTVKMTSGETCSNNVYWWVADYATLTDSTFIGSILAGAAITVTGGSLDGQALAKAAVTLTGAKVSVCGTFTPPFPPFPPYPPIKVTGGGQIPVPNPGSAGRATFGFNAQPDKNGGAKGNFNYVNHVTGLHVNGRVTSILVIAVNADGTPKTVLFSGTWEGGSFFVTVEDHAEPGTTDEFGITLTTATGGPIEFTSQRVISNGNIQFHGK